MKKIILIILLAIGVFLGCEKEAKQKKQVFDVLNVKKIENIKNNKDWILVDTRENDSYNGWDLGIKNSGGHIQNATDFSAIWLESKAKNKDKVLDEALEVKGISQDKNIVLYDTDLENAKKVADYLENKGYKKIFLFDLNQWIKNGKTLEKYENYQLLVPVNWVKDLIDGKKVENYTGKDFKIFEVSWGEEKDSPDYLKRGHIPGAIHINTDDIEEGPLWNKKSDSELIDVAKKLGITIDTTVILYGTDTMPASRVAVIFQYLGVKDVRLVNGGTDKWIQYGYPLEKTSNKPVGVDNFGTDKPLNKDYIIDLEEAKEIIKDKENSKLVDIRSWAEYIGETSGYNYIEPKGRPTGAVWGHCGSSSYTLEDFRNIDNTMRNKNEILKMWKDYGILPENRLAFYCGTGWRASEVLFYADVIGLQNISLYDGGWNEWSGNVSKKPNPISVGEPK